MIPYFGSFLHVPLLLAFVAALVCVLVLGALWGALATATQSAWGAASAGIAGLAIGLATYEVVARRRRTRRQALDVVDLETLAFSTQIPPEQVGRRALGLAQLVRLGVPVPDTLVLTSSAVKQWREQADRSRGDPFAALPPAARRRLDAFLHRNRGGKVVVRPSFVEAADTTGYPGVYQSVSDVDAGSRLAVARAVFRAVDSAESAAAREYRRRHRLVAASIRAVVLQRQLDAELVGVSQSRAPDGTADGVAVDYTRRRSPPKSVRYDLVDQAMVTVVPDQPAQDTPGWLTQIALLTLATERAWRTTVRIEFALQDGRLFALEARRTLVPERRTWLARGGPLANAEARLPRLLTEIRGGEESLRRVFGDSIREAGLGDAPDESDVADEDGIREIELDAIRRPLAELGRRALLSSPLFVALRLLSPIVSPGLSKLPPVGDNPNRAWQRFSAWHRKTLLAVARDHDRLRLRRWLARAMIQLLDQSAESRRALGVLHALLRRRERSFEKGAAAAAERLAGVEDEMVQFVAEVMGRGAEGWSGMFIGDRFHHAPVAELGQWVQEPAAREILDQKWEASKQDFQDREALPIIARRYEPPLPERAPTEESTRRVVGRCPGEVRATGLVVVDPSENAPGDTVTVLPDGRPEFRDHVLNARGLVFAGGGLLSPMATLAAELRIPTVVCIDPIPVTSFPNGHPIAIDGGRGILRF